MKHLFLLIAFYVSSNYGAIAQCNTEHSNTEESHWLSCSKATNPNNNRGESHWLMYNLGHDYILTTSTIWNYNVLNETGNGFKDVVIDYSLDGINWTALGSYQFDEAPGSNNYIGFEGPDFDRTKARYILITAINTWNNSDCAGLAEVKFNIADVTNTDEHVNSIRLTMYPNPVENTLQLDMRDGIIKEIKLFSMDGKLYNHIRSNGRHHKFVDVSYLPKGQYILQVISDESIINKQFTKL